MPLELFVRRAIVLDFSYKKSGDSIAAEEVEKKLTDAEVIPGQINAVLFKTGAAPLYGTDEYDKHYLEVSPEAVSWMAEKGIKLWGVDASTVDHAHNKATHMLLRKLEFYHIENLANLEALPVNSPFRLICVPLPFVGATASPLRPIAILEDE